MSNTFSIPEDRKLTIVCRVEPGCLGPQGAEHVVEFCHFSQQKFQAIEADIINWDIMPRYDKSQAELQYKINNKVLSQDKAEKYFRLFEKDIATIENISNEMIADLIDEYLGH